MNSTVITRRQFMRGTGALIAGASISACGFEESFETISDNLVLSANDDVRGNHFLTGFKLSEGKKFSVHIPFRGHGLTANPKMPHQVIVFGRRPGTVCAVVDTQMQSLITLFEATENRHFYGHGCFSADGRYLFTTENDYINGVGKIGIRELPSYRYVGEFDAFGIGPHDIHLLNDGKTLVVANGGIKTHPDYPRRKLNIPTMAPSLVYVDSQTGRMVDTYTLANHQLSIRHLHISDNDDVGVALQFNGNKKRLPKALPLIAMQRNGGELQLVDGPQSILASLSHYTADICLNPSAGVFAVTTPRGHKVTFWDYYTHQFLGEIPMAGVSGIVNSHDYRAFIVSTGKGEVHAIDAKRRQAIDRFSTSFNDIRWDNHMIIT